MNVKTANAFTYLASTLAEDGNMDVGITVDNL